MKDDIDVIGKRSDIYNNHGLVRESYNNKEGYAIKMYSGAYLRHIAWDHLL